MARISDLTVNGDTHLLGKTYGTLSGNVNGNVNGKATNAGLADKVDIDSTFSNHNYDVLFSLNDDKVYQQSEGVFYYNPNTCTLYSEHYDGHFHGIVDNATKLATPRAISLTGNATGSATFDGSGNVSINTTVSKATAADSATNADKIDGYHVSDLFRTLSGNKTPIFTDIFDRAGTIDMSTMSDADKAKHKANIDKAWNMTQNIWNNDTGIHAYGGDTDISGYKHGTLKLTQSYKDFDKILVVGCNDDGNIVVHKLWDVWELAYAFAHSYRFFLFSSDHDYWSPFGSVRTGTNTGYVLSTDTVWSCDDQNGGIIAIYGIKY